MLSLHIGLWLIGDAGFLPHGYCYLWDKPLLWTHFVSDTVIGVSYTAISASLGLLVYKSRRQIPFSAVFVAFGLFIVACGLTHFMEVWTLWQPHYWLAGGVKVVTAIASVTTAIAMPFVLPKVRATIDAAALARQREWAAGRTAALEEANLVLQRQAKELEQQREEAETLAEQLAQDAAHSRRLEAQLLQAQKMEAVGRLAGSIAHDFNNMLTAIRGFGDLVLDTLPPATKSADDMREILREANRATELTHQLLAFSRQQPLAPKLFNLDTLVITVSKMLRRLIGEHVDLQTHLTTTEYHISADPSQVEQIIVNLAVNARDAMPDGGVLTIATSAISITPQEIDRLVADMAPGQYVVLTVSDTGIGMNSEVQDHIFEPFFTTKERGRGTGLGLAMVYGVIQQSGGHIQVQSEPHRGTTFRLYFPLAQAEMDEQEALPEVILPVATRGHEKILVVEDEDAVRRLVSAVLGRQGYEVLLAADGMAALEILDELETSLEEQTPVDLVITDVVMPRMSGPDFVNQMSTRWPHTHVLYTSGYTRGAIPDEMALDPELNFMTKPFTPATLLQRVRELLDQDA